MIGARILVESFQDSCSAAGPWLKEELILIQRNTSSGVQSLKIKNGWFKNIHFSITTQGCDVCFMTVKEVVQEADRQVKIINSKSTRKCRSGKA